MSAPEVWSRLPIWTFEILSPQQRTKLPPVKVWRRLLRESGLPFTVRSVGLWISEYLSGSHRLGDPLDALEDQDPDQWRRHFETWHSASTIARHCGASERTIRDSIVALEKAGWLKVRRDDPDTGRQLSAMNLAHVLTIRMPVDDPRDRPGTADLVACPCGFEARSGAGLAAHRRAKHDRPPEALSGGEPPEGESGGADALPAHLRKELPVDLRKELPPPPEGASGRPPEGASDELSSRVSLQELPSGELTVDAGANDPATPSQIKSSPYELGRRYAGHVESGTMSSEDVKGIASHYSADDRASFLEGFREGAAA